MTPDGKRIVIADTGPIQYLILIEQISVLRMLFGTVWIPETVRREMLAGGAPAAVRDWVMQAPEWFHVVPDPARVRGDFPPAVDEGEAAAIQLALDVQASLLIIDDRAGAAVARSKGLMVTGTLGILDRAAQRGLVDIEAAIARLLTTNFRRSQALIDQLLRHYRRGPLSGRE